MRLLDRLQGPFGLAFYDGANERLYLATDRFGVVPIYYAPVPDGGAVWGASTQLIRNHPAVPEALSRQALFHYLYFHMIPSPATPYEGIYKMRPGEVVVIARAGVEHRRYWMPAFNESGVDEAALAEEVRSALLQGVSRSAADRPGTFLSGGLDSSTVTGLLARARQGDVDAYSIGFSAEGYDEMEYARLAARHFGVRHHEHYVTPDEVVAAVPAIAAAYDEPFGNSSAVPTYLCARLAADNGSTILLAGDGGDELFAGNARYLKQRVFEYYGRLPAPMRGLLETAQGRGWADGLPYARKLYRYVEQARIPLPDRLQSYNFMERQPLAEILAPGVLADVELEASRALLREEYHLDPDASYLNRMLRLDWRFTLADNDLRKVGAMTGRAGVGVRYPMLDDAVVAASLRIPSRLKMGRHGLRAFYKQAFRELLPEAILTKTKHGFGLPFGVWISTHPGLHQLAYDAIISLKKRDLILPAYLDQLADRHREEHAAYYGELIWVLMMLELWFQNEEGRHAETTSAAAGAVSL